MPFTPEELKQLDADWDKAKQGLLPSSAASESDVFSRYDKALASKVAPTQPTGESNAGKGVFNTLSDISGKALGGAGKLLYGGTIGLAKKFAGEAVGSAYELAGKERPELLRSGEWRAARPGAEAQMRGLIVNGKELMPGDPDFEKYKEQYIQQEKAKGRTGVTAGDIAFTGLESIPIVGGTVTGLADDFYRAAAPIFGETAAKFASEGAKVGTEMASDILKGAGRKVGGAASAVKSAVGETLTGVGRETMQKFYSIAKNSPQKLENIKTYISENPQNPFLTLASKTAEALNGLKARAQEAYAAGKDAFIRENPDFKTDISYAVDDFNNVLNDFGMNIKQLTDTMGRKVSDYNVLAKGKLEPFAGKAKENIQSLVDIIANAKNVSLDDLEVIKNRFSDAYNAIPLGVDKKPTKYHALVEQLTEKADDAIHAALPDEMKEANTLYRTYYDAVRKFGGKILDKGGDLKQGAETFVQGINNMNKGELRNQVAAFKDVLGVDIAEEADNIKTVQQMMKLVPSTVKNRFGDFLRAAATTIGGGMALAGKGFAGLIPAALVNIASSPKVYSNILEFMASASRGATAKKEAIERILPKLNSEEKKLIQWIFQRGATNIANPNEIEQ